ncbi:DUF4167 domain-containing protein [Tabrizicola oligotrophica]|uniref:DUF4167 domain-containing protein n=1 Tax=Tabrizicola oligotrophica TaxID=2710650 RepID=A0A6M0QP16_9RHOB|nr:DUF4167 domain-containing protein [Tabrizicola oligotrophica]NEY89185.1 DUF4167 domain-containing protein [Tabrizicola oligotrophica]
MRSSKSRSRSKQNRPRTLGNIINRVFDSSGPEGKVRGTPQQIIEKYQLLARDAQLSNDRVAAENFLQHAEHYTRLLAEAQREMAAEQEARQQFQQQNGNGGRDRNDRGDRSDYRAEQAADLQPSAEGFDVMGGDDEGHLVDLPEAPRQPSNPRRDDGRRDDRNRDRNQRRDDRPREDRARDDRPREERPREERPREDRPREDRRDDRPRDEQRREDRPREERPREPRREPRPAPEAPADLPSFITGAAAAPAPVVETPVAAPVAPVAETPAADAPVVAVAPVKPPRAPRAKKPAAPKPDDAPEAAE